MLMRGKQKPTPRNESSWVAEQLDGPRPKLTPREKRQIAEWGRRPEFLRAKAQVRYRPPMRAARHIKVFVAGGGTGNPCGPGRGTSVAT